MRCNVLLRADGVGLALAADGLLPEVIHWGADPGDLTEAGFEALALAHRWPASMNSLDTEPRHLRACVENLADAPYDYQPCPQTDDVVRPPRLVT